MLAQVEVCNLTRNVGGIQKQVFHVRKLLESLTQLLDRDFAFLLDSDRSHWTFIASDVEMIFFLTDHSLTFLGILEARGDLVLDIRVVDAPKPDQVLDAFHLRITQSNSGSTGNVAQHWVGRFRGERCLARLGDAFVYDHGCYHDYFQYHWQCLASSIFCVICTAIAIRLNIRILSLIPVFLSSLISL